MKGEKQFEFPLFSEMKSSKSLGEYPEYPEWWIKAEDYSDPEDVGVEDWEFDVPPSPPPEGPFSGDDDHE